MYLKPGVQQTEDSEGFDDQTARFSGTCPGKVARGSSNCDQVAAVVNKIAPQANVQAMSTKYGDTGVHWYFDAASVGTLDQLWDRIEMDPRYNEANVKMGGPRDFYGRQRTDAHLRNDASVVSVGP